jgi:hypothetical protein
MFYNNLTKHLKTLLGSGFTELQAKFIQARRSTMPSIADKTEHETEMHSCRNNACSQRDVTWQTDAMGLRKWTMVSPLIFFYRGNKQ